MSEESRDTPTFHPQIPMHVLLQDTSNHPVALAVPIQKNILVTADHVWETYGDLFFQGEPLEVFVRDFEHNLLFLKTSQSFTPSPWSSSPPVLGSTIFWIDGMSVNQEEVKSIGQKLSEEQIQPKTIIISGLSDIGNSGSPVFGKNGNIFGILTGADQTQQVSFAIRSDVIEKILNENITE